MISKIQQYKFPITQTFFSLSLSLSLLSFLCFTLSASLFSLISLSRFWPLLFLLNPSEEENGRRHEGEWEQGREHHGKRFDDELEWQRAATNDQERERQEIAMEMSQILKRVSQIWSGNRWWQQVRWLRRRWWGTTDSERVRHEGQKERDATNWRESERGKKRK